MTAYSIGLDLGTTNVKAVALDQNCRVLAAASAVNRIFTTGPGTAWQDPHEVWLAAGAALGKLAAKLDPTQAIGICISGAMHSLFPLSRDFEPLSPAITWADTRAGDTAGRLARQCDPHALYLRTGCPLKFLYHPAKIRRWLDEKPEWSGVRFGMIKDYVLWKLCKVWVTDFGLASASGLLDTHRYVWDHEALSLAGIAAQALPDLISPDQVAGHLCMEAAKTIGFPAGLPVVAGAGDGGLANLGAGAVHSGQSVITVGTSGAVRRISSQPVMDSGERTWCYLLLPGRWFHGGATNNAGLAVQWVRERFYLDLKGNLGYEKLFEDAANVSPGAEGILIAPYFAGERNPLWDADARAVIHGLALSHDRRHIARAILEGVGFCLLDIWKAMSGSPPTEAVRLTGMITSRVVWSQILCDQFETQFDCLEAADASAVGAAMLGWSTLGGIPLETLAENIHPGGRITYDLDTARIYRGLYSRFTRIYPSLQNTH